MHLYMLNASKCYMLAKSGFQPNVSQNISVRQNHRTPPPMTVKVVAETIF